MWCCLSSRGDVHAPGGRRDGYGDFPWRNDLPRKNGMTTPVGSYPPTATGLSTSRATSGSGPHRRGRPRVPRSTSRRGLLPPVTRQRLGKRRPPSPSKGQCRTTDRQRSMSHHRSTASWEAGADQCCGGDCGGFERDFQLRICASSERICFGPESLCARFRTQVVARCVARKATVQWALVGDWQGVTAGV